MLVHPRRHSCQGTLTLTSCGAAVAHLTGMSGGARRVQKLIENFKDFEAEEQLEQIEKLRDAEAICRALISNLKKHWGVGDDLSNLYTTLARIVRAQGRLDEAQQLCVEANNHYLVSQDLLLHAHDDLPSDAAFVHDGLSASIWLCHSTFR